MKRDSIAAAAERFARDIGPRPGTKAVKGRAARHRTRGHELTILHDEGLYRHLRFRSPDRNAFWFDIVTWPGTLVVRGDLGESYVFTCTTDMLRLFRGHEVNPHYWGQKLDEGLHSVMRYDRDLLEQAVRGYVVDAIRFGGAPRGIGKAVTSLLAYGIFNTENNAQRELEQFEYGAHYVASCSCGAEEKLPDYGAVVTWQGRHRRQAQDATPHKLTDRHVEGFRFHDIWEWSIRDYDWQFLWVCHAIVWGIARYDEARAAVAA